MIDAIQIARDLTANSSLNQKDAEAVVQTIVKVQSADLATKEDVALLRVEIAKVKGDLIYWIIGAAVVQIASTWLHK